MMSFFANRRMRKRAREILHHARHVRHMRGDLLTASQLERLDKGYALLAEAVRSDDIPAVEKAGNSLVACLDDLTPEQPFAWLRENLEILVVAIAVAMAFRTYFLQPFKIPTGSMQPTLYGIHARPTDGPTWLDRVPFKFVKWFVTGDWYLEVRAQTSGFLTQNPSVERMPDSSPALILEIGGYRHVLPSLEGLKVGRGEYVNNGQLLWAGMRTAGDHVLVDKVRWNFVQPRRGNVIVFDTKGIPTLPQNTYYIKRLAGLPGETISIVPPNLMIDGRPCERPESILRIEHQEPGYAGYVLADAQSAGGDGTVLGLPTDSITLRKDQYFALGDNTRNSRDSRYWGAVPQSNLVGPGLVVYWPFISTSPGPQRWGFIR